MKLMDYGLKPIDFQNPTVQAPSDGLSRRGFAVTALATGFAVASNPVLAQAIVTDSVGLVAGEVSIPVADGKIPGYRAMPAKPGKHPVLLVVQEIFGVHEHIKDMCRRFAKLGYYAIAPEMYARQGDVSKLTDVLINEYTHTRCEEHNAQVQQRPQFIKNRKDFSGSDQFNFPELFFSKKSFFEKFFRGFLCHWFATQ